jgi:hypothetical protein
MGPFPFVGNGAPQGLAPRGSNPALGLNASQPPNQNCADDNDKQKCELHLASIPFDTSEARVPKHANERPSTLRLVFEVA